MLPAIRNTSALAPANRLSGLFDEFFAPPPAPAWSALPLSVWADDDRVHVEMDAPGVKPGDLEVTVQDGVLTVQGERKCDRADARYEGRWSGRFRQQVGLPAGIDPAGVEARLADGVLSVTLPKAPDRKPRKIAVRG